jgi:aromatic-L-amino-acid/L-tryptophan decarboxylase
VTNKAQNTASDSALIAIVAARASFQRQYPNAKMEELTIYTTTQTHSLGVKAGMVLGISVRSLEVNINDAFALRGETLVKALEEDREQGRKPFILSRYPLELSFVSPPLYSCYSWNHQLRCDG